MGGLLKIHEYADKITGAWRDSVAAIIKVGKLLCAAKEELPHGQFGELFTEKLVPFSQPTANMLMKVAQDARIANSYRGKNLPASWRTLYELTLLSNDQWTDATIQGLIRGDVERKEIEAFRKKRRRSGRLDALIAALDKVRGAINRDHPLVAIWGNRLVAGNANYGIAAPLEFDTGLHLAVDGKQLWKVLSDLPEDDLIDFRKKNGELIARTASTKAGLAVHIPDDELARFINDTVLITPPLPAGVQVRALSAAQRATVARLRSKSRKD